MKKYQSIKRYGARDTQYALYEGADIVIQEKLDGANASFRLNTEGEVEAFSRNGQLDSENNLRGFYEWTQTLCKDFLVEGYRYFGEYTAKHKLDYGNNRNKFYLFDVYDENKEEYLDFSVVRQEANLIGLNLIPVFYEGKFQSVEHIQSFIGKSVLGEVGEGVVVKNVLYRDQFGNQQFSKFVSDAFAEAQNVKKHTIRRDPLTIFLEATLTEARVSKHIHKLVDEGKIREDFAVEDMGEILRALGSTVYDDLIQEEQAELMKVVKKMVGKEVPTIVKKILTSEGRA